MENSSQYQSILAKLTRNCRTTHESYATYINFYIANRKGVSGQCLEPEEFLKNNPTYLIKQAKKLAPEFSLGHLNYCAVNSSLRACMQGSAVFHVLMIVDLNKFEPAQQLRRQDFPDGRLEQLKEIISSELWHSIWMAIQMVFSRC